MSNLENDYQVLRIMEDDIPAKKRHLEEYDEEEVEEEESYEFSNSDIEELDNNKQNELKIVEHNEFSNDLNNNSKNSESYDETDDDDEFEEEDERVIYASNNVIHEAVNKRVPIPGKAGLDDKVDSTPNLVNEDEAIVNFLGDNNDIVRMMRAFLWLWFWFCTL